MLEGAQRWFNSPLLRQYLIWTFLFGAVVTLVLTLTDIMRFHVAARSETGADIEAALGQYAEPLGRVASELDLRQIKGTLRDVLARTQAVHAALRTETIDVSAGEMPANPLSGTVAVDLIMSGKTRQFGTLTLSADADRIAQQTMTFGLLRLGRNMLLSLILATFSLYAFHRLVNRHLIQIANESRDSNLLAPAGTLYEITRDPFAHRDGDELDTVVAALNLLREQSATQFEAQERMLAARRAELVSLGDILCALNFYVSFFDAEGELLFTSLAAGRIDPPIADLLPRHAASETDARALIEAAGFKVQTIETPPESAHGPALYQLELSQEPNLCWHMSGFRLRDGIVAILYAEHTAVQTIRRHEQARKMEALGTLASRVSHELNNIMSVLLGNIEMIAIEETLSDGAQRRLDVMQRMVEGLARIVERLMDPSLCDGGTEPIRATALFADLRELAAPFLTASIVLETRADDDMVLSVPVKKLELALANLVRNACEAIGDEGVIRISLREADKSQMPEFTRVPDADYVEIEVADSGPGIPEHLQDRVFEPFFSTKGAGSGAGLGLWSVYMLCKASGGTVVYRAKSAEHCGAFLLYIPISGGAGTVPEPPSLDSIAVNLLAVEDEEKLLDLYLEHFKARNVQIVGVQTAAEALTALGSRPFDALLCDYLLPDGDGVSICAAAKAANPDLKTIIVTGNPQKVTDLRCVDRVFVKPVNLSALDRGLVTLLASQPQRPT